MSDVHHYVIRSDLYPGEKMCDCSFFVFSPFLVWNFSFRCVLKIQLSRLMMKQYMSFVCTQSFHLSTFSHFPSLNISILQYLHFSPSLINTKGWWHRILQHRSCSTSQETRN